MRRLTVLHVAYSAAPVGSGAVGGAEQVLTQLDRALVAWGHRSLVVACEGSETAGILLPTPRAIGLLDVRQRQRAQAAHRRAIEDALKRWPVDVVHMHGVDFHECLPAACDAPVLVTLHLPPGWYPPKVFRLPRERPDVRLHCVSPSQRRACPADAELLPDIENGVAVEEFRPRREKRGFVFALGRICPEKGFHLALDAAKRANVPMLLAGETFPYPEHVACFEREIRPRLDARRRFIGPVGFGRKRRILASASCLLVPSLAPETSSLVAMEALASGTPVIAFPSGALPEIVEDGRTGFLVRDEEEMAAAIRRVALLDPDDCRRAAVERFSLARTIERYMACYAMLAQMRRSQASAPAPAYVD